MSHEPLTVRIPMTPDRVLSPNHDRANKYHRSRCKREIKTAAASATVDVLRGETWKHSGPIVLHISYYFERNRKRSMDRDNAIAMAKAAVDGVFLHLDADDRQITDHKLEQLRDPDGIGYMVIVVEPVAEQEAA